MRFSKAFLLFVVAISTLTSSYEARASEASGVAIALSLPACLAGGALTLGGAGLLIGGLRGAVRGTPVGRAGGKTIFVVAAGAALDVACYYAWAPAMRDTRIPRSQQVGYSGNVAID